MPDDEPKETYAYYLPVSLAEEIAKRAKADGRSLSQWLTRHLQATLTPQEVEK